MEERVRAVMGEFLELEHGACGFARPSGAAEPHVLTPASNVAGVSGADLAAPTVTCRLDETSGSRMYNLQYRVKGTRA
jgi:hypothetical protein